MLAAESGLRSIVEMLLTKGADINLQQEVSLSGYIVTFMYCLIFIRPQVRQPFTLPLRMATLKWWKS